MVEAADWFAYGREINVKLKTLSALGYAYESLVLTNEGRLIYLKILNSLRCLMHLDRGSTSIMERYGIALYCK